MDDKRWWDVISVGCPRDVEPEEWSGTLTDVLATLPPDDIVRFDCWMAVQENRAYRVDLWRVAQLANGGASDDGFYYFRLWLVGMGKKVFEAALASPDSLADVLDPNNHRYDYEAEMYGAASTAYERVLGLPWLEARHLFEAACEKLAPSGSRRVLTPDDWPCEDYAEYRRRLPRLAALYFSDEDRPG